MSATSFLFAVVAFAAALVQAFTVFEAVAKAAKLDGGEVTWSEVIVYFVGATLVQAIALQLIFWMELGRL